MYIYLEGHFVDLQTNEKKALDAATINKCSVKEVVTGINIFVACQAPVTVRRYADLYITAIVAQNEDCKVTKFVQTPESAPEMVPKQWKAFFD